MHTHCVATTLSSSAGSLSLLTGCGPGLTTDRPTQGGEEVPSFAKCTCWTAFGGPVV